MVTLWGLLSVLLHVDTILVDKPNLTVFRYSGNNDQKCLAEILVPFICLPYYVGHVNEDTASQEPHLVNLFFFLVISLHN